MAIYRTRIIILESNSDTQNDLREYFERDERFDLVGIYADGEIGCDEIIRNVPDAVLMSFVLTGLDGIGVLDRLKKDGYDNAKIVMGSFYDDALINRIMSKGADYYMVKPFAPSVAAERIAECVADKLGGSNVIVNRKKIDEEISTIFISIGIPPHIKGYNYLREGIKMTVNKPAIINNVTKELYPKIGRKFDTSASKVERAIRHAIEVAWNRGRIDAINAIFGAKVYIGSEKPTNSEFIALVADKIILENMM